MKGLIPDEERTTDLGLYNTAVTFLLAARALEKAKVRSTHRIVPVIFLYSHAVELFLKSYLRLQGLKPQEIRKVGHDVRALANRCERSGFGFDGEDRQIIDLIVSGNTLISTRYIKTGSFQWPSVGGLDRTGKSLRRTVRSALRAAGNNVR